MHPRDAGLRTLDKKFVRAHKNKVMKFIMTFSWTPDTQKRSEGFARFKKGRMLTAEGRSWVDGPAPIQAVDLIFWGQMTQKS